MASHDAEESRGAPRPLQAHRVASNLVAVQEEAQSWRDRRLALEAVMREERTRRLQSSAARKAERPTASTAPHGGHPRPAPASSTAAPSPDAATNDAPHTLKEYRRELDNDNGKNGVMRLHYYSSAHLDPADVHFYAVKARISEYQRHALRPAPRTSDAPESPSSQLQRRTSSVSRRKPSLTPTAAPEPVVDGGAEPWTRSALLRMEANQQVLRRIEARERQEAAYAGGSHARSSTVAPLAQGSVAAQVNAAERANTPPAIAPAVVAAIPAAREVPRSLAADRSYNVVAPSSRWGAAETQRSPPRPRFGDSPLLPRTHASPSQPQSRFEPSIVYGPSASQRHTATPWRPLHDGWGLRLGGDSAAHWLATEKPAIPQWDSKPRSPWVEQTLWRRPLPREPSPPQREEARKQQRSPLRNAPVPVTTSAARSGVAAERAEVEVSPLTPSPKLQTAQRGAAVDAHATGAAAHAKPGLLDGFRMPVTVLRREDLFQGSS